jgi:hypothetical protein
MAVVVRDRFEREPEPGSPGGLGGEGDFAVVVIGGVPYEVRRAASPGCFDLARVGARYQVWVGVGDCWSCSCPAGVFRRERPCKHAAALGNLLAVFRGVT